MSDTKRLLGVKSSWGNDNRLKDACVHWVGLGGGASGWSDLRDFHIWSACVTLCVHVSTCVQI